MERSPSFPSGSMTPQLPGDPATRLNYNGALKGGSGPFEEQFGYVKLDALSTRRVS